MTKTKILALGLLCASGASASECYSIGNYDQRLACLAQERGSPEGCLSIRGLDQRVLCRRRAERERERRLKEQR